jgi:hypothetical protein
MKTLIWFCKELCINNIVKSSRTKILDNDTNEIDEKECLCPWVTIESNKDVNYFQDFLKDIKFLSVRFKTKTIVLIPFVHLSNEIASQKHALEVINKLQLFLLEKGYVVKKANFGSSKNVKFFSPGDSYQVVFRAYPILNFKDNFKVKS